MGAWYDRKYHPKAKTVLIYIPEKNDFFGIEQSSIVARIKKAPLPGPGINSAFHS